MSIFLSFFFGPWRGGSFNLRPLCSANFVFGCALKIIWTVNSPLFPLALAAAAASLVFIYFIFFRILHEANEAWRCVCGNCCKLIWNYMHGNECAKCVCVSVCVCNLICVATIKCNLRLAGHLEVWVGERRAASFESCLRWSDEELKNSVNFERKRERKFLEQFALNLNG